LIDEIKHERPDDLQGYLERIADRWITRDLPRIGGLDGVERCLRLGDLFSAYMFRAGAVEGSGLRSRYP
jgi:hypothetical protein